jgi:hypothetical protein
MLRFMGVILLGLYMFYGSLIRRFSPVVSE